MAFTSTCAYIQLAIDFYCILCMHCPIYIYVSICVCQLHLLSPVPTCIWFRTLWVSDAIDCATWVFILFIKPDIVLVWCIMIIKTDIYHLFYHLRCLLGYNCRLCYIYILSSRVTHRIGMVLSWIDYRRIAAYFNITSDFTTKHLPLWYILT